MTVPKDATPLPFRNKCDQCGHEGQAYYSKETMRDINWLMFKRFSNTVGVVSAAAFAVGVLAGWMR